MASSKIADARVNLANEVEPESGRRDVTHDVPIAPSGEAIDFMGMFLSHNSSLNNSASNFDSCPQLELSLKSHPCGFENQDAMKKFTLRQSDASAFTRCVSSLLTFY